MNKMFVQGLSPEFHEKMTHLKGSFVDLIDMALRYENLTNKRSMATTTSGGSFANPNKRKFNPLWERQAKGKKSGGSNSGPRKCYNCQQVGLWLISVLREDLSNVGVVQDQHWFRDRCVSIVTIPVT